MCEQNLSYFVLKLTIKKHLEYQYSRCFLFTINLSINDNLFTCHDIIIRINDADKIDTGRTVSNRYPHLILHDRKPPMVTTRDIGQNYLRITVNIFLTERDVDEIVCRVRNYADVINRSDFRR